MDIEKILYILHLFYANQASLSLLFNDKCSNSYNICERMKSANLFLSQTHHDMHVKIPSQ